MRFEVRMPAYERPKLLKRALDSLLAQTHQDWVAIIFDDSKSGRVKEVVLDYSDPRVIYKHNSKQYGAALNIDQCFSSDPWLGGDYACLLEDDNFLLPGFFDHVYNSICKTKASLLLMNQRVFDQNAGLMVPSVSTRGDWFDEGWLECMELRAGLLLFEVLSNGGLVWSLDGKRNLVVGDSVKYTALHEACRTLLISERVWFSKKSEAVWTLMPKSDSARSDEDNRIISRGNSAIIDYLVRRHGAELITESKKYCNTNSRSNQLKISLAHSGHLTDFENVSFRQLLAVFREIAKGLMSRWMVRNPCKEFLRQNRISLIR